MGVLDLPTAILCLIVDLLRGNALLALFRTCTEFRDLLLRRRLVSVSFPYHFPQAELLRATLTCASVCPPKGLHLRLRSSAPAKDSSISAHAGHLLYNAIAALGGQNLLPIKSAHIQDYCTTFSSLWWLMDTCPNLTHLIISCDPTTVPPLADSALPIPQLTHLTIYITTNTYTTQPLQGLESQLRALTALDTLTLDSKNLFGRYAPVTNCLAAVGTQLKQLNLLSEPVLPNELLFSFPLLTKVIMPYVDVGDDGVEALLSLHHLEKIECASFQDLTRTFTNRDCTWTHLGVDVLDIAAWARLPLMSLRSIHLRTRILASPDPIENVIVMGAISHCNVQWSKRPTMPAAEVWGKYGDMPAACAAEVMPLLATCNAKRVVLCVEELTEEVLCAMERHLSSTKLQALGVSFGGCTDAVVPGLLSRLPARVKTLFLIDGVADREVDKAQQRGINPHQLMAMCCHGKRSMDVLVGSSSNSTAHVQAVKARLVELGNSQVRLAIREPAYMF